MLHNKTIKLLKEAFIMKKLVGMILFFSLFYFFSAGAAMADKSAVAIDAPQFAEKGTEITIKLNVTHHGNNMFHYTNWVYVKANGKEISRWTFSSTKTPESEYFTKEVKYTINEPVQIEAEANCNLHGSTGVEKTTISVK
jgi:desulfoferrodoxin (superoxide reductase-like protein)